jgi:hypothetical protein
LKRHRLFAFDFDTRAMLLEPVNDSWEPQVKELHIQNQQRFVENLKQTYGLLDFDQKLSDFKDLGSKPFSVVAFHNVFFEQARRAFISGQYYPALTAICSLGERVLNHLVLELRDYFKSSEHYKKTYRLDSIDNWDLAIRCLADWGVLTATAEEAFKELKVQRNYALHFNRDTVSKVRQLALEANSSFGKMLEAQFSPVGNLPWIFWVPGETYLKQSYLEQPFVKLVFVPNSVCVGPKHRVRNIFPHEVEDLPIYAEQEVSDDEFTALRTAFNENGQKWDNA